MNIDEQRLKNKLALWDTPGFSQFIEDLALKIDILDVRTQVEAMRRNYKAHLDEMQKPSKFKQTKLDI